MTFHVAQPYNIGFDLPTARPTLQRYPSTMDIIAENLGAGIGNALPGLVQGKIKQGILDKALAKIDPNASALDKFITLHRADPELAKAYAPIFKEEMKQQRSLGEQQALGKFYNQQFGMQQQPSPVQSSATAPIENPSLPPRPGQQEGMPLAQAEMPNIDFTQLSPAVQKIISEAAQKQREFQQKERHSKKASEEAISTDILKGIEKVRPLIPAEKSAVRMIKQSTLEGDLAGINADFLADTLHFEPFRTTSGALFKTAGKEYFLGAINSTGAKPNQWIEQQIFSMMPQIGRSREANMTIAQALEQEAALKEKTVEVYDNLAKQYRDTLGYVPAEVGKAASAIIKPYAEELQRKTAYQMRVIKEQENPEILGKPLKVPKGTPLTLKNAQAFLEKNKGDAKKAQKVAVSLGYDIPDEQIYTLKSPYDLSIGE